MKKEKLLNDEKVIFNTGGDAHQVTNDDGAALTTQQGTKIADDQNSLTSGERGATALEDFILREKIFHFDHERIPERVVHARGYGAHGYFESYQDLSAITKAAPLQQQGLKTPAFVRFSTVAGSQGSPDLARDVRGFAVKLYSTEGNWDIVGNNIPVFFIQDAIKFPDLIHAAKDEPDKGFPQAQTAHDNFWDFVTLTPESMNMLMWIMSDRTIPRSFRFMEGFGVHTFRLINSEGATTFVKFHWKPKLGMQSVTWDEALTINGADPDYHRRDLYNAIQNGDYPEWELGMQLFDEKFCEEFEFDILDATKLIPEEQVPVKIVGKLVLDRCVDNVFAETEQVAFCTQNIIPGIDFTNDPLLQGRNFSYLDTQLKRLGSPNFAQLPINAPKCPFANFQQDGHMAFINPKGRANYSPNSWHEGPTEKPAEGFNSYKEKVSGDKSRVRPEKFADHYSQARQFYLSQTAVEKEHIQNSFVFELSKVGAENIRLRMLSHLLNVDEQLAATVAKMMGIKDLPPKAEAAKPCIDLKISDKLSIQKNITHSFAQRNIGIILGEGFDAKLYNKFITDIKNAKAHYTIICENISGVNLSNGERIKACECIQGAPSALFDAVAILVNKPAKNIRSFITSAFEHKKFIGITSALDALLESLNIKKDKGIINLEETSFLQSCQNLRFWERNIN